MKIEKIRNILIFMLMLFSIFVIYTIVDNTKNNETFLKKMIINEAISNYNSIIDTRKWNASHGGVYVKQNESIKPNKYLKDNTLETKDGQILVKINPAWMTRQISEISNKDHQNYFKLTSLNPINPINAPDDFEKEALNYFEKNKTEPFYSKLEKDFTKFDFMGSLKVTKSCLQCHEHQGYKIGDIRGGIRISIPTKEYYEIFNKIEEKSNTLIALFIFLAIMLILIFIKIFEKLSGNNLKINKNLKEIKELEKDKEKLLLRYDRALEGSRDGLWDWDLVNNKVFFSKNWKKMLGFEDDELANELDEWSKRVHPDDIDEAIKDIKNNHEKKTTYYKNIHRMKHKDGHYVWILDRGKTYFNKEGKAIRMVGFHSDITELKNLEIDLKNTKKELLEFKFIIESAPVSIITTDTEGKMIYVNPYICQLSAYTKEELLGLEPSIFRGDFSKETELKIKNMWNRIKNKKTWGGIFKNKTKNNKDFWVTATVLPIINSKGDIVNFLGIMREITKEVYLEKKLKEKEEMMLAQSRNAAMGEMISMIAHQWRQPITTISMDANNIIADIELNEFDENVIKDIAHNIGEQTQFLSKTIDDFRNFFKEDKEVEEFKVSDLINELDTILLASIKNNNITYKVEYEQNLSMKTHKRELLQVLLNLVKNAKEALIENKNNDKIIKLFFKEEDENIQIIVQDNAGGIKEENLDKIFKAYFTTKKEMNGTGLGLYMSKMIIEKNLKGTIVVTNEKDGAQFIITIKKNLIL